MALIRPRPRLAVRVADLGQFDRTERYTHNMVFVRDGDEFVLTPVSPGQGFGSIQEIRINMSDLQDALNEAEDG